MFALAFGFDFADQTVGFVAGTGGEIQHGIVAIVVLVVVAETQRPQAVDGDGVSLLIRQRSKKLGRTRIEGVDVAVAEVADQQRAAKRAETSWGQRNTPRRIQWTVRSESSQ